MSSPTTTTPSAFSLPPSLQFSAARRPLSPSAPVPSSPNQTNPDQSGPTKNFPSPTLSPPLREPRSKEGGAAGLLISGGSPSDPDGLGRCCCGRSRAGSWRRRRWRGRGGVGPSFVLWKNKSVDLLLVTDLSDCVARLGSPVGQRQDFEPLCP